MSQKWPVTIYLQGCLPRNWGTFSTIGTKSIFLGFSCLLLAGWYLFKFLVFFRVFLYLVFLVCIFSTIEKERNKKNSEMSRDVTDGKDFKSWYCLSLAELTLNCLLKWCHYCLLNATLHNYITERLFKESHYFFLSSICNEQVNSTILKPFYIC